MDYSIPLKEDDKRKPRIWYLPSIWKEVTNFPTIRDLQDHLEKHEWANTMNWDEMGRNDWREIEKAPYIFLSRAPLTFGHSQLVIQSPQGNNQDEENFFCLASKIVERVIVVFRKAFIEQKIHKDKNFSDLAKLTYTEGDYIKTLILRSSASENVCREYKIHLVPYFKSHAMACQKHYTAIHNVDPNQEGGLLGWLGERETIVDNWQIKGDNPFNGKFDEIVNENLKMTEIAKELRDLYSKKSTPS